MDNERKKQNPLLWQYSCFLRNLKYYLNSLDGNESKEIYKWPRFLQEDLGALFLQIPRMRKEFEMHWKLYLQGEGDLFSFLEEISLPLSEIVKS